MSEPCTTLIPLKLVPSGVRDERQLALAEIFGKGLCDIDLSKLLMVDPLTVDARLLPYMIHEFGARQFIDPELPEHVQRRILKNIWSLKALHGYDAGVKLGLELLGMTAVIDHWWQQSPMGTPNTHDLTFFIGEQLFPNGETLFGLREKQAAIRMIEATKRQSQGSTIYIGAALRPRPIRIGMHLTGVRMRRARMRVRQHPPRLPMTLNTGQATRSISVKRLKLGGGGNIHVN